MTLTSWMKCALVLGVLPVATACGNSTSTAGSGGHTGTSSSAAGSGGGSNTGDAQTPPQGETAVKAWLAKGDYKTWKCEAMDHVAVAPSPHGFDRVCSNDVLAKGSPPFAQGSAAVKELYDKTSATGGKIIGYAVYLKTKADSAGGANWYWYEDNPTINPPGGVVADGLGASGSAMSICVGCHSKAGSDAMHPGAGDQVYTQVKM